MSVQSSRLLLLIQEAQASLMNLTAEEVVDAINSGLLDTEWVRMYRDDVVFIKGKPTVKENA